MRALDIAPAVFGLAAILLVQSLPAYAIEPDVELPHIAPATIDWDSARRDLAQIKSLEAAGAAIDFQDASVARLNAAASQYFPRIDASSVPVLLPFDPEAALDGVKSDHPEGPTLGFRTQFFYAGPTGYDAAFALSPKIVEELTEHEANDSLSVSISGFSLLYLSDTPNRATSLPVRSLEAMYPGIRRVWLEGHLRYAFERYGATYVVSMLCLEGGARGRRISCRDADRIIVRVLTQLRFAGGAPQAAATPVDTIDRPAEISPDFSYRWPGQLIPNTGSGANGGREDWTVYAKIRFPLAETPAYANSQSFLNWGNCDLTGRTVVASAKGAPYRCKVNNRPLIFDESAFENRSYPWRDNFCEHRGYFVGQCPNGRGHQGQDIRPAHCKLRNDGADRCMPYQDGVVAARDGMILRALRRESLFLLVNAPGERIRFRYLHMNPKHLDRDGLVSGRLVREGEFLGKVGNYDRGENGTTYHLHFDMQVPTRDGWVYVNPFMTLVTAYERLIGARGRMIDDEPAETSPLREALDSTESSEGSAISGVASEATGSVPRLTVTNDKPAAEKHAALEKRTEARDERANRNCPEEFSARRRSRDCEPYASGRHRSAKHSVHKLGRKVSHARHRARRVASHVRSRHERSRTRHYSLRSTQ